MRNKGVRTLKKEMKHNRLLLKQLKGIKTENIHLKELVKNLEKSSQTYMMYIDPEKDRGSSRSKKKGKNKYRHKRSIRKLKFKDSKDIPIVDLQDGAYALKQLFTY